MSSRVSGLKRWLRSKRAAGSAVFTAAGLVLLAVTGWTTGAALADGGGLASFLARSPGERGETELSKTKGKGRAEPEAAVAGDPAPTQRALGKIFETTPESALAPAPEPVVAAPLAQVASAVPTTTSSSSSGGVPGGSTSGGFFGGSSGSSSSGGNTSSGSSSSSSSSSSSGGSTSSSSTSSTSSTSGGTTTTTTTTTSTTTGGVVGAVPEPGTWMTMLLGMAMTGAALRSSRRTRRRRPASCASAA